MLNQANKLLPKKKEITVQDLEKLATEGKLTGWHEALPANVYHAAPGVGSTDQKRLLGSPKKYAYLKANPEEPTEAMMFGSIFHAMLLEMDTFEHFYCVKPLGTDRRTKVGKEAYEAFEKANVGKTIITHQMFELAYAMIKRVREHPRLEKMLKPGKPEFSVFSQGPSGVVQKGRADLYLPDGGIIVDFKSTDDSSPAAFSKKISNLGYFIQAGTYLQTFKDVGLPAGLCVFIAIEKKPPYEMGLFELDPEDIDLGMKLAKKSLSIYANCKAKDLWPGRGENFERVSMPRWGREHWKKILNG